MHPAPAFRIATDADALAFVAAHGFAHIFAMTPRGPRVAHAPVLVTDGRLRFHLSNGNTLTPHLDGATALASVGGPGSYVSPNWYERPADSVPTWNYTAIEIDGWVRRLDADELAALLDLSSATFEPRVGEDWTMAKMEPRRATAMKAAITGFELVPQAIRATDKWSQNRSDADATGVVAAMEANGDLAGGAAVRRVRGW